MILFVCTGNTCRSPMASALARSWGYDAYSAGLAVWPGSPATPQARRAVQRHGGDLSGHRAQPVTEALVRSADVLYAMSPDHVRALTARFPGAAPRIRALEPAVPDPYGGDDAVYEECILHIIDALKNIGITP